MFWWIALGLVVYIGMAIALGKAIETEDEWDK